MEHQKITTKQVKELLAIATKLKINSPVSPTEAEKIIHFQINDKQTKFQKFLTHIALPGSIVLGMTMAGFPAFYTNLITHLPAWTNMKPNLLNAVDYVWSIIGKPVKQPNIIYHIPNVILYSFGVLGVKKLFEYLRKKTWLDKVIEAKSTLKNLMEQGKLNYNLNDGHSLLFIGEGDFIGQQFYMNNKPGDAVILSGKAQNYTAHWLKYDPHLSFNSLQQTLDLADAYNCGEYILFPIIDTEIFLPGPGKYDLSPEKTEVMIQAIRDIERIKEWPPKRIIIVGDKKQQSSIRTETISAIVDGTSDSISLETIKNRFEKIIIIDPTDLVIETILKKYPGRKILFRSSIDGGAEYKKRFYERLGESGYQDNPENDYSLVVGYDLYEEQIERESIATNLQEYVPVVLSREVYDALIRNGYSKEDFIYVPEIVLDNLRIQAEGN
ncbi:MAG: hypothetical protein ACHQFW_00945 [Chitinophagales bacterium]